MMKGTVKNLNSNFSIFLGKVMYDYEITLQHLSRANIKSHRHSSDSNPEYTSTTGIHDFLSSTYPVLKHDCLEISIG